jgi:GNAT superfamily N-acetyltransferase
MAERVFINDVTLLCCCGDEISPYLDAAARLRIEVFRAYPYLYEGTIAYEREYLEHYIECPESIFVCAIVGEEVVGVSTALPLIAADKAFQQPFLDAAIAIEEIYYLGESVLLPQHRGSGIGHAFFDQREAQAKKLGYKNTTFCSVIRPDDHPSKPQSYRSNETFWQKRGYQRNGLHASFEWQEVNAIAVSSHAMEFWSKRGGAPAYLTNTSS